MRDGQGSIICSGYSKLGKALEAVHTKIIACLQALQRVAMLGIQKVVLETDIVHVVQAINQPELDRSSASGLLWEFKECLLCNFSSFVVAHNPHSCNLVAHSLAALRAKLCPSTNPIMDSIPPCIDVLVANDLASGYE